MSKVLETSKLEEVSEDIEHCHQELYSMSPCVCVFLASQDALEVMGVTEWVTDWWLADLTDVTLVSDDTFCKLYWCDSGEWGYWWSWPEVMHQKWCTRGDAPEVMHQRWCTRRDAPEVMHQRWCTRGVAPEVMHQRWCTRWKEMIVIKAKEVKIVKRS